MIADMTSLSFDQYLQLSPKERVRQKFAAALHETIRSISEIDKVLEIHGGWPTN